MYDYTMVDSLVQLSPGVLAVVPLAIGLVQLLKRDFSERYQPFLALVIGVGLSIGALGEFNFGVVIQGLAVGLIAMGVFSGTKHVVH